MNAEETLPIDHEQHADHDEAVITTGTIDHLHTCSLVLSAVGIPHALDHNRSELTVPAEFAGAARHHLDSYFEENRNWPEQPPPQPFFYSGNPPTLLLIGGLAIFYLVTGSWQDNIWFSRGAIDSRAILSEGQWWRLITALTLHADQVHLVGNCLIGGLIIHLLSRSVGYGLAFFLLVFCGMTGNFLNIALRETAHLSVGFSTSIFAGIGLLSGLQVLSGPMSRLRNLFVPIGAGVGLLAMLGTEGERTDLGAHLFGFLCGVALGILARRFDLGRMTSRGTLQEKFFLLSALIVLICWMLALG